MYSSTLRACKHTGTRRECLLQDCALGLGAPVLHALQKQPAHEAAKRLIVPLCYSEQELPGKTENV